jgi:hypothetical protein
MAVLSELIAQAKSLTPVRLQEDDPLQESNWNTLCDYIAKNNEILEKLEALTPPVGFIYIRLPGALAPDVLWEHPSARWRDISGLFPGVFFRVAGGLASSYRTNVPLTGSTPPAALVYNTGDNGSGGGQQDAIRNIKGSGLVWENPHTSATQGQFTGVFYIDSSRGSNFMGIGDNDYDNLCVAFDASRMVPVAGDNHPKNITVQILIRDN